MIGVLINREETQTGHVMDPEVREMHLQTKECQGLLATPEAGRGSEQIAVYWYAPAASTKYHSLGGLNNRNKFSHSSRGWKSQIKVLAGSV